MKIRQKWNGMRPAGDPPEGSGIATAEPVAWQAGDLRIEPGRRRVLRGDEEIALPGLSFDLLMALVRAAPDLLPFSRLIDEVWSGQAVSPETVTQRVKLVRDALGDDSQNPRYIAGIRGQGYRLLPSVVRLPPAPPPHPTAPAVPAGRTRWGSLTLLLVPVLAFLVFIYQRAPDSGLRQPGLPAPRFDSIAVLPFENRSVRAEDAFFADGIHDDLLARLSRLRDLRVIARGSVLGYRKGTVPLREIARELGVGAVMTGAVQRSGDAVRIQVQLIDASRDAQIWSSTFDRSLTVENVFAIQSEIGEAIAANLRITLLPADRERFESASTTSLRAYDAWLRGRHEMRRYTANGLAAAVAHFQDAVATDPEFALAHLGLAESRLLQIRFRFLERGLALQLARASVERVLAIEPSLAEAFAVKGDVLRMEGNETESEAALRQAIALNPNLAAAYVSYGWLLGDQGRLTEQIEMWRRAGLLDPQSPEVRVHGAFSALRTGRLDEAERQLRALLERHPDFPPACVILGEVHATRGEQAAAVGQYRRALALNPGLPLAHAGLVQALVDLGRDREALQAIEQARLLPDASSLIPKTELVIGLQTSASPETKRLRKVIAGLRSHDPHTAALYEALLDSMEGRYETARAALENAAPALRNAPADLPLEGGARPLICTYAFTLLQTGDVDRGRAIARSFLESMRSQPPLSRQPHVAPIVCQSVLGDEAAALTTLRKSAVTGVPGAWRFFASRPELARLRAHPGYDEILAGIRTEAGRQSRTLN